MTIISAALLSGELEYDKAGIDLGGAAIVNSVTHLKLRGGFDLVRMLIYATAGAAKQQTGIGEDTSEFVGVKVAYKVTDRGIVGGGVLGQRIAP